MAMTAADRIELQKQYLSLDDYVKDRDGLVKRIDKVEACNDANKMALVKIETQLKLVLGVLSAVGLAVLSLVVKQFWG